MNRGAEADPKVPDTDLGGHQFFNRSEGPILALASQLLCPHSWGGDT